MKELKIRSISKLQCSTFVASAAISAFTALFFHGAFFRTVVGNISPGWNGVLIVAGMTIILLVLNFLVAYILLNIGRITGRLIVSFFLIGNSLALYFIKNFHALIDDRMMGNVFHTTFSEAGSFFSVDIVLYVLMLGVLPVALLWSVQLRRDSGLKTIATVLGSLALIGGTVLANSGNFLWIDRNVPVFGSQLLPWSYVVNTFRYVGAHRRANVKEIVLPDAQVVDSSRAAVVLVIGESARSGNFQLCGYDKPTNPKLITLNTLKAYKAISVAANTIDATRAIVTHADEKDLYEILPNYLYRNGVGVMWQTSNWGEPPVHVPYYRTKAQIAQQSGKDGTYDAILFDGVKEFIDTCSADKVLAVVHTYTSHGPAYYENYPPEYEVFTPVCKSVEVASVPQSQLVNAYDNTIVYTDAMLYGLISGLQELTSRKCAVIFLSDHGESLGENGRYMHGAAPGAWESKAQEYEIPFIVWSSDASQEFKDVDEVDQHFVYHSVMDFLGLESTFFDPDRSVFRN